MLIGIVGNDIHGRELIRQFQDLSIDTSSLVIQEENFDTYTFTKKYADFMEEPRIDFGFFNKRSRESDELILNKIAYALENFDALVFNQQVPGSLTNDHFINEVNKLFKKYSDKIVLFDSRHYSNKFKNVFRKMNDIELVAFSGKSTIKGEILSFEKIEYVAKNLQLGKPVFVTCGERGILSVDSQGQVHKANGIQILTKLDTVGAGDTVLSALASCLAVGITVDEAASFANYAAAVTIQKLFITGTASSSEILDISNDPDYIYNSDLSDDIKKAQYYESSSIEICNARLNERDSVIKHLVFDFDGTISTLRQGWNKLMREMMIDSISGNKYIDSKALKGRIERRVDEYIEKSTGIQTVLQMEALVSIVKEFGLVDPEDILDKFEYKDLYNQKLLEVVNGRIEDIIADRKRKEEFLIRDVISLLEMLKNAGITTYLVSGTDERDVKKEAKFLEVSKYFTDRTYGSVDDIKKFSKKKMIDQIIRNNQLSAGEIAVIGDGPVEIREGRKRGGITIGVASNENTGYGLNIDKRSSLIKAGADIIISDFTEAGLLLQILFKSLSE
jgi:sugar/nucleoside kinase (ribokinase family)/phosphoglycolate phosphatase-like HAD superfamily hydrolase